VYEQQQNVNSKTTTFFGCLLGYEYFLHIAKNQSLWMSNLMLLKLKRLKLVNLL